MDETVDRLLAERNVSVHHGAGDGWWDKFREIVSQKVQEESGMRSFLMLDVRETGPDIGKYLFEGYCPQGLQNRFASKEGYAKFLATECGAGVGDYYIWLYGINKKSVDDKIMDFVAAYSESPSDRQKAIFIVESGYKGKKKGRKNIGVLEQESKITQYDMALFAMELLNGTRLSDELRRYMAELASAISKMDPKLCVSCIHHTDEILKDPEAGVALVLKEYGTETEADPAVIRKRIWEAQIRIFYPKIETERLELINKYRRQIERQLPAQMPFGATVTEANMAELGMLKSMKDTMKVIMEPADVARTDYLWSVRNTLAHLQIIQNVVELVQK